MVRGLKRTRSRRQEGRLGCSIDMRRMYWGITNAHSTARAMIGGVAGLMAAGSTEWRYYPLDERVIRVGIWSRGQSYAKLPLASVPLKPPKIGSSTRSSGRLKQLSNSSANGKMIYPSSGRPKFREI